MSFPPAGNWVRETFPEQGVRDYYGNYSVFEREDGPYTDIAIVRHGKLTEIKYNRTRTFREPWKRPELVRLGFSFKQEVMPPRMKRARRENHILEDLSQLKTKQNRW